MTEQTRTPDGRQKAGVGLSAAGREANGLIEIRMRRRKDMLRSTASRLASFNVVSWFALLTSIASAYFSFQSAEAKKEKLVFIQRPDDDCKTNYVPDRGPPRLGICWELTIANDSDDRIAIVDFSAVSRINSGAGSHALVSGDHLDATDGGELPLPLIIDAGDAKRILFRDTVSVPPDIAKILSQMSDLLMQPASVSLGEVENRLASRHVDMFGDRVSPIFSGATIVGYSLPDGGLHEEASLSFRTARNNYFTAHLSY